MSLVNWDLVLLGRGHVDFSSLEIPDTRDEFDRDIAQISLRNGYKIDISWNPYASEYVVVLLRFTFDNHIRRIACRTPHDIVETVVQLVEGMNSPMQAASALTTESAPYRFQLQHA